MHGARGERGIQFARPGHCHHVGANQFFEVLAALALHGLGRAQARVPFLSRLPRRAILQALHDPTAIGQGRLNKFRTLGPLGCLLTAFLGQRVAQRRSVWLPGLRDVVLRRSVDLA